MPSGSRRGRAGLVVCRGLCRGSCLLVRGEAFSHCFVHTMYTLLLRLPSNRDVVVESGGLHLFVLSTVTAY